MPTINVLSKNNKSIKNFHLKINIFTAVKYFLFNAWACLRNVGVFS